MFYLSSPVRCGAGMARSAAAACGLRTPTRPERRRPRRPGPDGGGDGGPRGSRASLGPVVPAVAGPRTAEQTSQGDDRVREREERVDDRLAAFAIPKQLFDLFPAPVVVGGGLGAAC